MAEDELDPLEDPQIVFLPLLISVDDHWFLLILPLLLTHVSIGLKQTGNRYLRVFVYFYAYLINNFE